METTEEGESEIRRLFKKYKLKHWHDKDQSRLSLPPIKRKHNG